MTTEIIQHTATLQSVAQDGMDFESSISSILTPEVPLEKGMVWILLFP